MKIPKLDPKFVVTSIIAIALIATSVHYLDHNQPVPDWLRTLITTVVLWYFGAKSVKIDES